MLLQKEKEKKDKFLFNQIFIQWISIEVPHSPNQARVEVIGENSAQIWWLQPDIDAKTLCTKFKGDTKENEPL